MSRATISRQVLRWIVLFCVTAVLITPLSVLATAPVDLVILHVNDTHGHFSAAPATLKRPGAVGMPRFGTVIREIRRDNEGRVLLLHGGDLFSKGEPVTIHTGGGVNMKILAKLGVDALVPGNGEFYFGLPNLLKQIEKASIPVVMANLTLRKTQQKVFEPYRIIERNGVRIGIVGLGWIRTEHHNAKSLVLENAIEIGGKQARAVRGDVDLLIGLTHIGHWQDLQLAQKVPEFDIIVGGHSHRVVKEPVRVPRSQGDGDVVVLQAGDFWRYLGRADVRMEKIDNRYKVTGVRAKLIEIQETAEPDPVLEAILEASRRPLNKVIARKQPKRDPAAMYIATLEATKRDASADIVILDHGVVQSGLAEGSVTWRDIYRVHPWRNEILKTTVSGTTLLSLLPKVTQCSNVSMWAVSGRDEAGKEVFLVDGRQIIPERKYAIAVGDFTVTMCQPLSTLEFTGTGRRIDAALLDHCLAWR